MLEVGAVLSEMAYRLAGASQDATQREALRETLETLRASAHKPMDVREFLARGDSLRRAVSRLAGNPFLELFLGITYLFGGQAANEPLFTGKPERMAEMEGLQFRMAESVLNREPEVAVALRQRVSGLLDAWASEDGDPALRTIGGE
jgi:hypothetical protein